VVANTPVTPVSEDLTSEFHRASGVGEGRSGQDRNLDGTRDTGEQFELLLIRE